MKLEGGKGVVVFLQRDEAEAFAHAIPPHGHWAVKPVIALELLAWLREKRSAGAKWLFLNPTVNAEDPDTCSGYRLDLAEMLDRGDIMGFFDRLAKDVVGE
jgi:hypothetical protein